MKINVKSCVAMASGHRDTLEEQQVVTLYFPGKDQSVSFYSNELPEVLTRLTGKYLLIAFNASDTLRYQGNQPDVKLLDLQTEFKWLINGKEKAYPDKLLDLSFETARQWFGLSETAGSLFSEIPSEVMARSIWQLYLKMAGELDIDSAIRRGQYVQVQSRIEGRGIPMDVQSLRFFAQNFDQCFEVLARSSNCSRFFSGSEFNAISLRTYIEQNRIAWPVDSLGQLRLDKDTISDMSDVYSDLAELKQLYKLSLISRDVACLCDSEGFNRLPLNAYKTSTGRNAPGKGFILNQPKLLRRFISPPEGQVIIEMDYGQQEFAVAAGLSGDSKMTEAYLAGDVYRAFADSAGALPVDLSPEEKASVRGLYKQVSLAILYGISTKGLSIRLGCSESEAQALLQQHKELYQTFWSWLGRSICRSKIQGYMTTDFGWRVQIVRELNGFSTKQSTLQNWLMQTTGAEMTRRAVMLAESKGLTVIASNHDALYIQCLASEQTLAQKILQECMEQASLSLIPKLAIRTDSKIISPSESPVRTLENLIQFMKLR